MENLDFIRVEASHPAWNDFLRLFTATNEIRHEGHGSGGTYKLEGRTLTVFWEKYEPEVFVEFNGVYIHEDLSNEVSGKDRLILASRIRSSRMSPPIAVLVLAYRYPDGVEALSKFFAAADIDMFVHVDAKISDEPFREAAKKSPGTVIFTADRVAVFWRGFTMVQATIALLKAARLRGSYDRYVIISDDSLPLLQPAALRNKLELDSDYIEVRPVNDLLKIRYERFLMLDSPATQVRWIPVIDREVTEEMFHRCERLIALRRRGKKPRSVHYHGSQWMALTASSVDAILESWETDPWLRESFEFSEVPDEAYFHTILSEHGIPEWRPLMYADWSVPSPPKMFKTLSELSTIDARGALFVRKIDFGRDDLNTWVDMMLGDAQELTNPMRAPD